MAKNPNQNKSQAVTPGVPVQKSIMTRIEQAVLDYVRTNPQKTEKYPGCQTRNHELNKFLRTVFKLESAQIWALYDEMAAKGLVVKAWGKAGTVLYLPEDRPEHDQNKLNSFQAALAAKYSS